MKQTGLGRKN